MPLEDIFDLPLFKGKTSHVFKFPSWLFETVKELGWQIGKMEPEYEVLPGGDEIRAPRLRRNYKYLDGFKILSQSENDLSVKDNLPIEDTLSGPGKMSVDRSDYLQRLEPPKTMLYYPTHDLLGNVFTVNS
jgi:hypothetical protein